MIVVTVETTDYPETELAAILAVPGARWCPPSSQRETALRSPNVLKLFRIMVALGGEWDSDRTTPVYQDISGYSVTRERIIQVLRQIGEAHPEVAEFNRERRSLFITEPKDRN